MLVCQCGWRCVTGGRRTHVSVSVWLEMCDWREEDMLVCQCGWRCVTVLRTYASVSGGRTHASVSVCGWRYVTTGIRTHASVSVCGM